MWIINKWAYRPYSLLGCLKLICPLDFTVLVCNVLAVPLRSKWKHMCKTNHSLSSQMRHELPDQREMREATFQTGPQGPWAKPVSLGPWRTDLPGLLWLAKAPAGPSTFALVVKGKNLDTVLSAAGTVGNNVTDKPCTPRRHLLRQKGNR